MSRFDFALSEQDIEVTRQLMMYCDALGLEYFSSDTFREAKLDAGMTDPIHEIGAHFARLKANGVYEAIGEIPSEVPTNNERKVDLWRFNWMRWRIIIRGRMEAYV